MANIKYDRRETAAEQALKAAYSATARGNVYSQLGLVLTNQDFDRLKLSAARVDLKKEIEELKADLNK